MEEDMSWIWNAHGLGAAWVCTPEQVAVLGRILHLIKDRKISEDDGIYVVQASGVQEWIASALVFNPLGWEYHVYRDGAAGKWMKPIRK